MRNFFYNTLKFSPAFSNLFKNRLRVLAYHDILDPVNFEAQLLWLKSQYNIIDIPKLKDHLFHKKELPPNPLLITLDDGDRTVFTKGLPIFKKHQIPSCLFIITDLIDTNKDFWWNTITKNEKNNGLSQVKIMEVINKYKSMPNKQRIRSLDKYPATYQDQLTIDEVKELNKNRVFIGNHSHTHPMFDKLEKDELLEELKQVRMFFEENGIGDFAVFAYPNGNLCESTEQLLLENNIQMAFLFDHKINEKNIDPLRISRLTVDDTTPLWKFKFILSGWHTRILPLTKAIGQIKR